MDKLDLLVGITLANYFRGGTFTPEGTKDKIKNAIAFGNKILQEDVAFRITKDEEPLELTEAYMRIIAQSVGVYYQAEWASKESLDKQFEITEGNCVPGANSIVEYVVPTGKTLYIVQASCSVRASVRASRDKNQMGTLFVRDPDAGIFWVDQGGNGGSVCTLPTPAVIPAGHRVWTGVANDTNHNVDQSACSIGYEL